MKSPTRTPARAIGLGLLVLAVTAAAVLGWWRFGTKEEAVGLLDPAQVRVVRTPGGWLEVATLQKPEEFAWRVSHDCPPLDCGSLFGSTTSEVRVTAHVTYRIALAAQWSLRRVEDHYELAVPQLEAKKPVAFETANIRIRTEKSGWFSPDAGPNREAVVRHLGAELDRRADDPGYKRLAEPSAGATVAEFAKKWTHEQGTALSLPVHVRFGDAPAARADAPADR